MSQDIAALHGAVHRDLLPRVAARIGRPAAEARLPRFKVLGGLGPAATADFLAEMIGATPARDDREHLRLDVAIDPLMGRTGNPDPLGSMQSTLDALLGNGGGATALCLPCNTAHDRVDGLRFDRDQVRFVSMIDAAVVELGAQVEPGAKVGILATRRTVESGLYRTALARAGFIPLAPEPEFQERVDAAIYGDGSVVGVKGGDVGPGTTALVQRAASHLIEDRGAAALCLACTELPLVFGMRRDGTFRGDAGGRPVVNATRALALAFLRTCLSIEADALRAALPGGG